MRKNLQIVLADFDTERCDDVGTALQSAGCKVSKVANGLDVLDSCNRKAPDVLVMEAFLPRRNGFEVLKALKEDARTSGIRVVLLIDEHDEYGSSRARLCGADAVLTRPVTTETLVNEVTTPSPTAAPPALENILEAMDTRAKAENPLVQHITDSATGLFNKPYTDLKLSEECKKARRFQIPLSCVVIALDDHGVLSDPSHADELRSAVNEVAGLLLCESRDIDHLSRYQTQEFLLLLPHTDRAGASAMARRILDSIAARGLQLPGGGTLTGSAGIAAFSAEDGDGAEGLVARAREALKVSRHWGGNRFTLHAPDTAPQT
ncbi:MAG: diguanylate cyclase [Planctomycetes bacterium]|nr:diguanylate cyclase [Planctomycetota bacterium]